MNKLKPFEYLKYIFETMPNITPEKYSALLPWNEILPECCKLDAQQAVEGMKNPPSAHSLPVDASL
jgi:hypothetical protein